ncbi:hypothetical protein Efla_005269 [Eimeria flavescens]
MRRAWAGALYRLQVPVCPRAAVFAHFLPLHILPSPLLPDKQPLSGVSVHRSSEGGNTRHGASQGRRPRLAAGLAVLATALPAGAAASLCEKRISRESPNGAFECNASSSDRQQSAMASNPLLLLLLLLLLTLLLRSGAEQQEPLQVATSSSPQSPAGDAAAAKPGPPTALAASREAGSLGTAAAAASHAAAAVAAAAPGLAAAAGRPDAAGDAAAAQAVEKLLRGHQQLPLTYSSILQLLPQLQRRYPHLIRVREAVEAFGLQDQLQGLKCGRESCRVPYLEVGLRSELNRSTPTIFYSGLVHGDEVVGPTAAVYLAAVLASQFDKLEEAYYLLSNRLLVIFPFVNPWGFSRQTRQERAVDPNRDFPYMNPTCFSSLTSKQYLRVHRLVAAAFERYLFIGGITWHGGMRAIARPWGSFDHSEPVRGGYHSRPAPDEKALATIGRWLQEWTKPVSGADPALPPQSWLVQSRKAGSTGGAPKGSGILKGGRQWLFPTRSPSFPGNPSPVGFSVQIRADGVEGFVALSLPLPATPKPAAVADGAAADTPQEAATELQVALTIGGFLNDAVLFFNPYTHLLEPYKTADYEQQQQQQQRRRQQELSPLSMPGATTAAADVVVRVHPGLSQLPQGLLLLQIERHDPTYTRSSSSSNNNNNSVWLPAAAAAGIGFPSAAAAAAAAEAQQGVIAAAGPLAGSQHVPLLSDQVNEDFAWFALQRRGVHGKDVRFAAAAVAAAVVTGRDGSFFPYVRSFALRFESSLLLPQKPPSSLAAQDDGRRLSSRSQASQRGRATTPGDRDRDRDRQPSIAGALDVSSVWTRPHSGVTSLVGEFTADEEGLDMPLLLQFAEGCCVDLLLHRQANGWAIRAALELKKCACGPGTVVTASLVPTSRSSSSSSSSIGPDEELLGARVYTAAAAAAADDGGRVSAVAHAVYAESSEQRERVLQQLQQQQQQGDVRSLTPHEVAATVRRAAGVKAVFVLGPEGLWREAPGAPPLVEQLLARVNSGGLFALQLWGLALLASLLIFVSVAVLAFKRLRGLPTPAAAAAAAAAALASLRRLLLGGARDAPYQVLGVRPSEYAADVAEAAPPGAPAAAAAAAPAAAGAVADADDDTDTFAS